MSKEAMKLALEAAYLAGWNASGEGYNAEYPFGDHARNPEEDAAWVKGRDDALREALAEQPAQTDWEAVAADQAMTIAMMKVQLEELIRADEREAIAQSLDKQADLAPDEIDRHWAQEMAAAVRAIKAKIKEKNT